MCSFSLSNKELKDRKGPRTESNRTLLASATKFWGREGSRPRSLLTRKPSWAPLSQSPFQLTQTCLLRGQLRSRLRSWPVPLPVCRRLLEQVLGCGGLLVPAGLQEEQVVTWFQFHNYLQRQSISDLEQHLAQLTKEGRA